MSAKRSSDERRQKSVQGVSQDRVSAPEFIRLRQNRYEIIERLSLPHRGRWLVRDHRPPPKGTNYVAIILENDEACQQLRRSLARLPRHANSLPSLVDHGRLGDDYCLVIDWWKGMDLGEYLRRVLNKKTARPSPTQFLRLFRDLVHSLRLLHDQCQVIHGDLKPANLILTSKPTSLRMIDFGSSWQLQRTSGRLPGDGTDPIFAAPEFFLSDGPLGPESDQFSVGVMLYLVLTLTVPFDGLGGKVGHPDFRSDFADERYQLKPPSEGLEIPDRIPADILQQLDALVFRMLRIDPRERFPNSRAWSNAFDRIHSRIQQATHAEPILETPLGQAIGFLKRLRRGLGG